MDYLFRGIARNDKVRILALDATESIKNICNSHKTLPITTVAFSKFLLAGTMIGALEKNGNGVTLQINSDGPIKHLFMQATPDGKIRGYVADPEADLKLNEYSIEKLIGNNGVLSVTKVFDSEHDFTSDVLLVKSDITQDIANYFYTSEQIPTIINLQVDLDDNGQVKDARGYLIQLLTGYENEDLEYLEHLKIERIIDLGQDIKRMFPDFLNLEEIIIKNTCDCSKEKFYKGLETLSIGDLIDLANDDITVACEFCKNEYKYSKEELLQIIDKKSHQV